MKLTVELLITATMAWTIVRGFADMLVLGTAALMADKVAERVPPGGRAPAATAKMDQVRKTADNKVGWAVLKFCGSLVWLGTLGTLMWVYV